ncbi:unnamed protein product [Didymodactylos carnosus]|uniref:Uncharacterized protein n=1 Tax=Didymodactylos carnosus TaxID=1234261 RepID=A0A814IDL0_9BILA|nr:unnamed protein product [Didymodactylos carnosus]CAF1321651.1 unnamed protein product [Didymodactylos carnosus]CAF3792843.1 unnamed protein product [Didymodactylos carnosus]CAF4131814.1 unnamed protein product [Didymodactylos carnosus]
MNNNNPLQVPLETVKKPKVVKRSSTAFSISPYFQNYDPTKPVEPTTVEKLLSEAGSFGIYQIFVFLLLGFSAVIPSMISFSYTLAAGIPPHRCKLYENETYIAINPQHQLLIEIFIPEYNQLTKQDYQCTFNRKIPKETIKYLTKNLTSHTIEEIIKSIDNETLKESEFIKSQSYITPIATKYKRVHVFLKDAP